MKKGIATYLNDHLAGSSGALRLIESLTRDPSDPDCQFFIGLLQQVKEDRETLEHLIGQAGFGIDRARQWVGSCIARLGLLRQGHNGLRFGQLGKFETMEILVLGIHGKHLLWKALAEVKHDYPAWEGFDFATLAETAAAQREDVELLRLRETMPALNRVSGKKPAQPLMISPPFG
jgi:hypothetical protein